MAHQFGIIAKYWQPGEVKTRLAIELGAEPAAELHRACLQTLLHRFAQIGDRRVLAFTPADRGPQFATSAGAQWQLEPQSDGDLGRRIERHFESAFAAGATRAVLIGSDSPTLPEPMVAEAFGRLAGADAVVGPSDDGGYYLVGLSRPISRLFDGIAWSTPAVWPQTVERLKAAACRYHVLAPWYDIDTSADLARLRAELACDAHEDFAVLRQVVREIDQWRE